MKLTSNIFRYMSQNTKNTRNRRKSQSRIHVGVDKVVDQRFASAQAKGEGDGRWEGKEERG